MSGDSAAAVAAPVDASQPGTSSDVELRTVIDSVVHSATLQTSFPLAALALMQPKSLSFDFIASADVPEAFARLIMDVPVNSPRLRGSALERAIATQQPAIIADVCDLATDALTEPVRSIMLDAGIQAYVCVPLVAKGRFQGALFVYDHRPRPDAETDLPQLMALADQAAVAIANARLYDSMEESLRQTRALQRVTAALAGSLDLHELLDLALTSAMQLFEADRAAVFLADRASGAVSSVASRGLSAAYLERLRSRYGSESPARAAAPDHRYVADAQSDPLLGPLRDAACEEGFRSMLFESLRYRDQPIGTFVLYHDNIRAYSDAEIGIARTFADQVAIGVEHARLFAEVRRAAALEERNRLARELHDSVKQSLFSIALMADAVPQLIARTPDRAEERVQRIGDLARGALAEMSALILELRPAALEDGGRAAALRAYAATFQSRENVSVRVLIEREVRLRPDAEEALFRIAQEALNNVAKHAAATAVTVELTVAPGRVSLCIQDDGRGFDPSSALARHGFGMTSMRERATLAGATLAIVSAPDNGTAVRVDLPTGNRE
ncbi:MAG: sensor histidine kinase [Dehalococcoidia bacterium]